MKYKKEIQKLKTHRKKYFPVVKKFLDIHDKKNSTEFPVEILDPDEIRIITELYDNYYLDRQCFKIRKTFSDITSISYYGGYPLSEKGYAKLIGNQKKIKKNIVAKIILLALAAILLITVLLSRYG